MSDSAFTESLPLLPIEHADLSSKYSSDSNEDQPITKSHGYSIWVAICFALNYSIGAGILGLPYEFINTGYILSSIIIIVMGLLSYITNMYIVDAMLRAESLTTIARQSYSIDKSELITKGYAVKETLSNQVSSQTIKQNYIIQRNEYQLSELISIFCGIKWRVAYDISFGLSTLIGLWSYNVLFAVSLSRNFGIPYISDSCNMEEGTDYNSCRLLYSIYVLVFWVWTMIITLVDFHSQQWLQIGATGARVIIIILMISTAIGLMYSVYYYDGYEYLIMDDYTFSSDLSAWDWSGIAYMIAVASFAFGSQFCVMDVVEPLSAHDKRTKQHVLWASSTSICVVAYILCGVVISFYFGENTQDPCTLAWEGFMGFTQSDVAQDWAVVVAWVIVLLPAIDIGSSFPLIATTLANTLEAIMLSIKIGKKEEYPDNSEEIASCYASCYNQRYVVLIKISLCTLVSAIALVIWDFELILALCGAFKLLAVYAAPCFLEWKSRQFMKDICMDNDTDVADTFVTKNWISHVSWFFIIVAISFIAFVAVFVYTIVDYL